MAAVLEIGVDVKGVDLAAEGRAGAVRLAYQAAGAEADDLAGGGLVALRLRAVVQRDQHLLGRPPSD